MIDKQSNNGHMEERPAAKTLECSFQRDMIQRFGLMNSDNYNSLFWRRGLSSFLRNWWTVF